MNNNQVSIDKVFDKLYTAIESVCNILLIAMVLVISYTVFGRFILNDTPTWGEELSIFCMVWVSMLGASLAVRDDRHIRMTIIEYIIPKKFAKILHKLIHLLILIVGLAMLIGGFGLVDLYSMSRMSALGISSKWLALSIPVSGAAILIMLIARFRRAEW